MSHALFKGRQVEFDFSVTGIIHLRLRRKQNNNKDDQFSNWINKNTVWKNLTTSLVRNHKHFDLKGIFKFIHKSVFIN